MSSNVSPKLKGGVFISSPETKGGAPRVNVCRELSCDSLILSRPGQARPVTRNHQIQCIIQSRLYGSRCRLTDTSQEHEVVVSCEAIYVWVDTYNVVCYDSVCLKFGSFQWKFQEIQSETEEEVARVRAVYERASTNPSVQETDPSVYPDGTESHLIGG